MCLPGEEKESVAFLPVGVIVITPSSCLEKLRRATFLHFWPCEDRGSPGSSFGGHSGPPSMMHTPSYHLLLLSHLGTIICLHGDVIFKGGL